jgi:hypothetical protein
VEDKGSLVVRIDSLCSETLGVWMGLSDEEIHVEAFSVTDGIEMCRCERR